MATQKGPQRAEHADAAEQPIARAMPRLAGPVERITVELIMMAEPVGAH